MRDPRADKAIKTRLVCCAAENRFAIKRDGKLFLDLSRISKLSIRDLCHWRNFSKATFNFLNETLRDNGFDPIKGKWPRDKYLYLTKGVSDYVKAAEQLGLSKDQIERSLKYINL